MNFHLGLFLVRLLDFSWYIPLTGTFGCTDGEVDFRIFRLGISTLPFANLLVRLVGFLVLDYIANELNHLWHALLHL